MSYNPPSSSKSLSIALLLNYGNSFDLLLNTNFCLQHLSYQQNPSLGNVSSIIASHIPNILSGQTPVAIKI